MKADFSRMIACQCCQRLWLRSSRFRTTSDGYTLVEMLVVIAIIAVLAGLLLPQLGVIKERFRRIACANHVRQIHSFIVSYMKDHDDVFPLFDVGNGGQATKNAPTLLDEKLNVLIPQYVRNLKVFQCPTRLVIGSGNKRLSYHYQYNPNLSFCGTSSGGPPRVTRGGQIRNPGALRLVWDSIDESKSGSYDASCNHGVDGGNVIYYDGHLKWFSGAAFRANEEMDPDMLMKR